MRLRFKVTVKVRLKIRAKVRVRVRVRLVNWSAPFLRNKIERKRAILLKCKQHCLTSELLA